MLYRESSIIDGISTYESFDAVNESRYDRCVFKAGDFSTLIYERDYSQ